MDTNTPTCEVCGQPATNAVGDIRELPPVNGWRSCESAGRHWYCDEHRRESVTYPLPADQATQAISPETANV